MTAATGITKIIKTAVIVTIAATVIMVVQAGVIAASHCRELQKVEDLKT